MSGNTNKDAMKYALDRATYWDTVYKSSNPTIAGQLGVLVAFILPTLLYNLLPGPSTDAPCEPMGRIQLLFTLQLFPACVLFYYVVVTGLQRVPVSPTAAHDPAAAYVTGQMPMSVIAANRAFINTLEQYAFLFCTTCLLAMQVPCDEIGMLPALYITWSLCRVVYLHGYLSTGHGRMLGFPGTVMPTLAAFGYATYLVVQKGTIY
eukprot:m.139011 g.139011  ORF g.139011 m.139011 type:complete len:206 (+) comp30029_c2_seq4:59-676(+)